jgi:plastocyanin
MKKIMTLTAASALLMTAVMAKDIVIDQKDKTFIPNKVEANVGDKLVFKNSDGFAHNAYTDNEENEFDIGMQKPGQDVSVELKHPGLVEVECAIHPNMHLSVTVK